MAFARQISSLIKDLHNKGTTIFLTTHYIEEAERLCERIAFIVQWEIVREGTVAELMQKTQQENIICFTLGDDFSAVEPEFKNIFPDYEIKSGRDSSVSIHSPASFTLLPLVQFFEERGILVFEANIVRPSLEEVFVNVTGIELQKIQYGVIAVPLSFLALLAFSVFLFAYSIYNVNRKWIL